MTIDTSMGKSPLIFGMLDTGYFTRNVPTLKQLLRVGMG